MIHKMHRSNDYEMDEYAFHAWSGDFILIDRLAKLWL